MTNFAGQIRSPHKNVQRIKTKGNTHDRQGTKIQELPDGAGSQDRLAPAAEAIRKRAQMAEKELADIKAQRDRLQSENQTLTDQIRHPSGSADPRQLLAAGPTDLETAELLVRDRLANSTERDVSKVIERLRRDKGWLFAPRPMGGPLRTAGLRFEADRSTALQEAARKAARSGQPADVQEYLRLRRQVV